MSKVTFIGLGTMGYPMAGHLLRAGHDVTVYNRTAEKAHRWVKEYGGKAVPAHIDREANGILAILGEIPPDLSFDALEFSPYADETIKDKYHIFRRLTDSDAHRPTDISDPVNFLEAEENSVEAVFAAI